MLVRNDQTSTHTSMRWVEQIIEVAEAQQERTMDGVDTVWSINRRSEPTGRCARSVEHLFSQIVQLWHFFILQNATWTHFKCRQ